MGEKTEGQKRLAEWNTYYSQDRGRYRQFAEAKRMQTSFRQERLTEILDLGKAYIMETQQAGNPLTVSGLQLACRCNKQDFYRMKRGEYDWRVFQFMEYNGIEEEDLQIVRDNDLHFDVAYWTDPDGVMYCMNMFSEVIDRFYLILQEEIETKCYMNKGNPSGLIFCLKSVFGWSDKPTSRPADVQPVHVATKEEAQAAINELYGENGK